jgi:hypothetical protein
MKCPLNPIQKPEKTILDAILFREQFSAALWVSPYRFRYNWCFARETKRLRSENGMQRKVRECVYRGFQTFHCVSQSLLSLWLGIGSSNIVVHFPVIPLSDFQTSNGGNSELKYLFCKSKWKTFVDENSTVKIVMFLRDAVDNTVRR